VLENDTDLLLRLDFDIVPWLDFDNACIELVFEVDLDLLPIFISSLKLSLRALFIDVFDTAESPLSGLFGTAFFVLSETWRKRWFLVDFMMSGCSSTPFPTTSIKGKCRH
jgi:hypothetical protein